MRNGPAQPAERWRLTVEMDARRWSNSWFDKAPRVELVTAGGPGNVKVECIDACGEPGAVEVYLGMA